MVCKTAVRAKSQAWLEHNVAKVLLFFGAGFDTCVEAMVRCLFSPSDTSWT